MGTSVQLQMKLFKVALIASLGCEASNAWGPDECKACSEECQGSDNNAPGCQESCHRECEEDTMHAQCMQTCMYDNCRPELECDMKILSDAVRSFCQRDYNGDWKCAVNCPGQLQAFFGEHEVQALDCTNGKLVLGNFGFDTDIAQSMMEVDGPLECRKPDLDMDAIIDEVIKESPCRDQRFHRCQKNSHCVPTTSGPLYTCDCDKGFKLKGRVCASIAEKVSVDDKEKCPDNFVGGLTRASSHQQLKRPVSMEGANSVILQVEPNIKGSHLNGQTYTAFIEFHQNQCGTAFAEGVLDGKVEFSVYDAKGSRHGQNSLYTLVGQFAFLMGDPNGVEESGTVLQITKNFRTLAEMNDSDQMEINQHWRTRGNERRMVPSRDSFYLEIAGDVVSENEMYEKFETCFDPRNLVIHIVKTKSSTGHELKTSDLTACYYRHKLGQSLNGKCTEGAIVDGKQTDVKDKMSVLFNSDFARCFTDPK